MYTRTFKQYLNLLNGSTLWRPVSSTRYTLLLLFVCLFTGAFAQQAPGVEQFEALDEVGKKGFFKEYFKGMFSGFTDFGEPFDVSGGLGINMRSYSALGISPRQDPFFYSLNANVNVRIYKLNAPFSLMISAKNKDAAYPNPAEFINAFKNNIAAQKKRFVRFGTSPRFKWIKLHLGHRTMIFSQYSMSNLVFFGAGTELTPGKIRFSAMYGRLAKAEPVNLSLLEPNIPKFERKGWGMKVGYGTQEDFVEAIVFQAKDDPNSIFIPDSLPAQVSPEQNQVIGLVGQKIFLKKFKLKVDLGASALSPNSEGPITENKFPHPAFLFQGRQTTKYRTAFESSLDYQAKLFTFGVKYKRVDPEYRTHGAYFFNSDIEDRTVNLSTSFLDGAITFNGSGGLQSNNLDGAKPNRLTKAIGTFDLAYNQGPLSLSANYSNNSSNVAYLLNPQDPTLNVIIVTNDAGFSATYTVQDSSKNQHVFNLTGNSQIVTDDILDPTTSSFSKMYVANFVYTVALAAGQWNLSLKANYNQNALSSTLIDRYGGGLTVGKSLFEGKVTTGLDFNYFRTITKGLGTNGNTIGALRLSWKVSESNAISMNWNYLQTQKIGISGFEKFGEVVGTLAYQYTFARKPKQKAKENEKAKTDKNEQKKNESKK